MIAKLIKNQRGTVFLEFALIFPIFIAMVLGIINLALLLNNSIVAQSAARDTANTVAVTGNVALGIAKGQKTVEAGGLGGSANVTADQPSVGNSRVTARVSYQTPVVAPGIGALLGGKVWDKTIDLREETSYYVEYRHRTRSVQQPSPFVGWIGWHR